MIPVFPVPKLCCCQLLPSALCRSLPLASSFYTPNPRSAVLHDSVEKVSSSLNAFNRSVVVITTPVPDNYTF